MLKSLNKNKMKVLLEYCVERFDMSNNIFKGYELYEGSKNKIYLVQKMANLRFIPESSGLCIFRFDKTPKPTTNFLQLFGSKIKRNILDLNKFELREYCKGNDLESEIVTNNLEPGFIAIRYKKTIIGCAHWNQKVVKNQLPKSRRCRINYC